LAKKTVSSCLRRNTDYTEVAGCSYVVVNEELDDSRSETVVRTGDSYQGVVDERVSEAGFRRSPREPRQVEIAHQFAAVERR